MRSQQLRFRLAADETYSDSSRHPAGVRPHEIQAHQRRIVLDQEEAARLLDALDTVDQDAVARLRELHDCA